jgi:hypothetical protein
MQNFVKISRTAVDDSAHCVIFVVPLDAGLHQSQVRGSVFSRLLGLQIELNFVPVYCVIVSRLAGSERGGRDREAGLSFLMPGSCAETAGSLKSTYRVVNTTF